MDEIKLKPCPFCGGVAEFFATRNYGKGTKRGWNFGICCVDCMVALPKTDFSVVVDLACSGEIVLGPDEREKAAQMWNRRAEKWTKSN